MKVYIVMANVSSYLYGMNKSLSAFLARSGLRRTPMTLRRIFTPNSKVAKRTEANQRTLRYAISLWTNSSTKVTNTTKIGLDFRAET